MYHFQSPGNQLILSRGFFYVFIYCLSYFLHKIRKSLSDQMKKSNGKTVMNKNPKMNEIIVISSLSVAITPMKSPNGLVAQKINKLVTQVMIKIKNGYT
ncbi:hypothetical protein QH639_11995 [Lysinibacillus sp. 1 U-2021]|uniref:hypothetical protein n=1 Tax=Lysinibacillus sp. 1 U-2021 TaxID=3039426 RepID=UPI002480CDE4|nr:hypothetical protein [Lysinibacillus sp. 1 U-2021]WGT41466.1 hypothetical protein QH639_11995 [Lysinibacillus sp. 1 U-2021]